MSQEASKVDSSIISTPLTNADSRILVGSTGYRFLSPYPTSTVWKHPQFYNSCTCSGVWGSTCDEGELPIFDRKIADLIYAE